MSDWIVWKGGECPVAPKTRVDVRFRGGEEDTNHEPAHIWEWSNDSCVADIIAYRVHAPSSAEVTKASPPAMTDSAWVLGCWVRVGHATTKGGRVQSYRFEQTDLPNGEHPLLAAAPEPPAAPAPAVAEGWRQAMTAAPGIDADETAWDFVLRVYSYIPRSRMFPQDCFKERVRAQMTEDERAHADETELAETQDRTSAAVDTSPADLTVLREENARLREALMVIRRDQIEVWDEEERATVVVSLDADERAKVIDAAFMSISKI